MLRPENGDAFVDGVAEVLVALCKAFRGFYSEDFIFMLPSLLKRFCTADSSPVDCSEVLGAVAECLDYLHFERIADLLVKPSQHQMSLNTFAADSSAPLLLPIVLEAVSTTDPPILCRNAAFLCGKFAL